MDWIIIFALAKAPIEVLEYKAVATEQQCIELGEESKASATRRLGDDVWVSYRCLNIRDIVEGRSE